MATTPFPIDAELTAIALAYRNPDVALIADDVLPRTPTSKRFKYLEYGMGQGFTVPSTKVGRKSQPNQVSFEATELTDEVEDHGLDDYVPNEDIEADNQGIDPLGTSVGMLTNLVNLAREVRVAGLVFSSSNFDSDKRTTLSGTSQWSHADSDPVAAIGDALDIPFMRPNIAVFGQAGWTKARRNPKLVAAIKGSLGRGMVSRAEFAEYFELNDVFVGQGFVNTAKKGQPPALVRVWGKHAAFLYRDRQAGPQSGITYGFTAEWGKRIATQMPEPKVGLTGSVLVRSGERVKEKIVAKSLGYFFQNIVN